MKIRLYAKILLFFLLILGITEVLIFGLFVFSAGPGVHARFERLLEAQKAFVADYLESKLAAEPQHRRDHLRQAVQVLARAYDAKVWVVGLSGETIAQSFPGAVPEVAADLGTGRGKRRHFKGRMPFYEVIPIRAPEGGSVSLHLWIERLRPEHSAAGFALGLGIIGLAAALLTLPLSRHITRPLKQLQSSALRFAKGDLEHRASVTTGDEIGELARTFNHMAEALERAAHNRRELIANLSHELRSPLARIQVCEELLRGRLLKGDYADWPKRLEAVREEIATLDRLIGRILELSRLDLAEKVLKRETVDCSALVNGMLRRLEPALSQKELSVETEWPAELLCRADRDALHTALSNILDNAQKFTPAGGRLVIRLHPANGSVQLEFENSGPGVEEEDLKRVFEPFYRTSQAEAAGTGLGLAIACKIVERHGGTIEAYLPSLGFGIRILLPA